MQLQIALTGLIAALAISGCASTSENLDAGVPPESREAAVREALRAPAPEFIRSSRVAGLSVGDRIETVLAKLQGRDGLLYVAPTSGAAHHQGSLRALRYDRALADAVRAALDATGEAPGGAVQARWDSREASFTATIRGCYGRVADIALQVAPRFSDAPAAVASTTFPDDVVSFPDETFDAPAAAGEAPRAPLKATAEDNTWAMVDDAKTNPKRLVRALRYPDLCRRISLARAAGGDWSPETGGR